MPCCLVGCWGFMPLLEKFRPYIPNSYRLLALLSVLFQVISIILLKFSIKLCEDDYCKNLLFLYVIIVLLMLLRVVFWNLALSVARLSEVYRFTSLTPVLLLLFSAIFFHEKVSFLSGVGVFIITMSIYIQQREKNKGLQ